MEKVAKLAAEKVASGQHYEAQQLYKAQQRRMVGRKKYKEALWLLVNGCNTMVEHKQYSCAVELGELFVGVLEAGAIPVDEGVESLLLLLSKFPDGEDVSPFVTRAITWSKGASPDRNAHGHPALNAVQANRAWQRKEYMKAANAFVWSCAPEQFSDMIVEWAKAGFKSERDLFIARAVLALLAEGNLKEANVVFQRTSKALFSDNQKDFTPLMNFIRFLLLTCERDAFALFGQLTEKYAPSLARDSSFRQQLASVAEVFFGVKQQNPGNLLTSMMQSLFAGPPQSGQ